MKKLILLLSFALSLNGMESKYIAKKYPIPSEDVERQYLAALYKLTETDPQTGQTFEWVDIIDYRHHPKHGALITRYKDAIIAKANSDRLPTRGIGVAKERLN